MPEISTGCLLSAMFVDVIRASIHDRDKSGLARGCGEQGINVKRVASMLVGLGTRPVRTEHDFASKAEMEVDEPADEFCAWG